MSKLDEPLFDPSEEISVSEIRRRMDEGYKLREEEKQKVLTGAYVYINEEYINRKHLFTTDQIKGTIAKWRNSTKKFTRQELKEGDFYITIPDFKQQELDALRRRGEYLRELTSMGRLVSR